MIRWLEKWTMDLCTMASPIQKEAVLEEDKEKMTVRFWRPVMKREESLNLSGRKNAHKKE